MGGPLLDLSTSNDSIKILRMLKSPASTRCSNSTR